MASHGRDWSRSSCLGAALLGSMPARKFKEEAGVYDAEGEYGNGL